MGRALKKCVLGFVLACLFCPATLVYAQTISKPGFIRNIPALLKALPKQQKGITALTIIMQAADAAQLFPADPKKRLKGDFSALITDGSRTFFGTLAPGGQSSLKVPTPNLRLSDLEEVTLEKDIRAKNQPSTLAGVPIIDKTLRINPMTMDEGYINTLTYIELVNHFHLLPSSSLALSGEYAKATYRFVDPNDQWAKAINPLNGSSIDSVPAGLHLVNFHPIKYLKSIDADEVKVLAVARSRYNVLNTVEKAEKLFGKKPAEDPAELFSSSQVKNEKTAPFRVEIKWAKKTKAEKEQTKPQQELQNVTLMKDLLTKAYAAPVKYQGKELATELNKILDLQQLFRFMAINRLIENGDISDEYFWYIEKNEKSGKTRLGIMPQDGDDMFKGAHFFPTTPKQIGLIFKGSKVGKELGLDYGYIINYEDPLFRVVHDDSQLFFLYLQAFEQVAQEIAAKTAVDKILAGIAAKIAPYAKDADVRARGKTDERGAEYSANSFDEDIRSLKGKIKANASKALLSLHGTGKKPGDLAKIKEAAGIH